MSASLVGGISWLRLVRTGALVALACAPWSIGIAQFDAREVLNSERIEQRFGSYGVEVLEASQTLRVSNLYSQEGEARTCRTFAVVLYPAAIDAAVKVEHAAIAAGGSIGAVFAANGWTVRKTHLRYGARPASARLAELMKVDPGSVLAEHAYVLDVVRDGQTIEYAALVEIHHPAHLGPAELMEAYGPITTRDRPMLLERLLAATEDAVER